VKVYVGTFLFAVASALFPLLNVEAFIAGLSAIDQASGLWLLSFVAGLGQAVGKVFWYQVGSASLSWRYVRRKMATPSWHSRYEAVKTRTDERPWTGFAFLFFSALTGLPPLAITAVLAGQLRLNRLWFYLTVVVGRTLRFAVVIEVVDAIRRSGLF
jgi:membrane protein YqaA with SNARE-associated domain